MDIVKTNTQLIEKLNNTPSFGGNTLPQNIEKAETALKDMDSIQQIWNHSHSQWTWKHLNLEYLSPMKNMRQVSAEISNKRLAFEEAKFKYLEEQVKIEKLNRKLEQSDDELVKAELQIKIAKYQHNLKEKRRMIDGALKDILTLHDLYNQLKEKLGDITEEDVEREEVYAHLQRSIVQCIRDVRINGAITKGEQQYLEQIGVNPSKMQEVIRAFVSQEKTGEWSTNTLNDFVRQISKELIESEKVHIKRMQSQGFSNEYNTNFLTGANETS